VLRVCRSYTNVCANWAIAVTTAMRRYVDRAVTYNDDTLLRATCAAGGCDSDASLRRRTITQQQCAMLRYVRVKCSISATRTERLRQRCVANTHVNVIFLLHTPQSVACVLFVYLCVGANWAIAVTTAMLRYADGAVTYDGDTSLRATCA